MSKMINYPDSESLETKAAEIARLCGQYYVELLASPLYPTQLKLIEELVTDFHLEAWSRYFDIFLAEERGVL